MIKSVRNRLVNRNKEEEFRNQWRTKNSHNYTVARFEFPDIVEVGKGTYGTIDVRWYWNKDERLTIGNYCSIADDVIFMTGGNHTLQTFSQFPFGAYYDLGENHIAPTKGPIIVEDDVWIGQGAMILSGVTVGQGAVIGARSVVSKDVPPYAIYVGNRVAKYRFPEAVIEKMVKFDFSKLTSEDIVQNKNLLNTEIDATFFETDFYKQHLKD